MLSKIINKYANLVSHHPLAVIIIMLVITGYAVNESSKITMEGMDYQDMLPDDMDVIKAMYYATDEFASTNTVTIVLETDPKYIGSNEVRDMRDPRALTYMELLAERAEYIETVSGSTSAADIYRSINNGYLPKSIETARSLSSGNARISSYISEDYTMAIISLTVDTMSDSAEEEELEQELTDVIEEIPSPPGVSVALAGDYVEGPAIQRAIVPSMSQTSTISLVAILITVLILFRSLKHGLIPLTTILFGVVWAFGFMGAIGMNMNTMTSGVISMIMGIGIDFGIQTVSRYREEMKDLPPKDAMEVTITNVLVPMATTTLAALIGFRAMTLGQLTLMGDLGTIMSYGVTTSFIAAITIVPALLVISDMLWPGRKRL